MDKFNTRSGNWLDNALASMSELSEGWAQSQEGFDRINHLANDLFFLLMQEWEHDNYCEECFGIEG